MGRLRAVIAQLGILVVFAIGFPQPVFADDAGPRKDVRAVRYDLPKLMAGQDLSSASRTITIDAVAADGDAALAQWHDASSQRIDYLVHRFDRWWIDQEFYLDASARTVTYKTVCSSFGARSEFLSGIDIPKQLVTLAAQTLPAVIAADARSTPAPPTGQLVKSSCDVAWYSIDDLGFSQQNQMPMNMGGYAMKVRMAESDADSSARIRDVRGRPPTEAESWVTPGGNSYFFFSGTVQSSAPVHVAAGTTIDVWFPFVLDPSLYYGLTIAHTGKPIGPIDGTLRDNVVHFVLPAFTLPPGATLMGEIEGDSFRHES